MKIMHICQFLGVGGLEKVLYSLIKEQVKLGHEVEVVVYDHNRRWVEKYTKELGVKVHTDYTKQNGYDFNLIKYLKNKIQNFDIIHTHDLNPMLYLGPIKLFTPGLKIIHTTHGMEHLDTHPKTRLYETFLGFIANCIIAVSPKFKEYYQSQLLTKKSKVHLIDNGTEISNEVTSAPDIGLKEEVCDEFKLDKTKPIAIYVARVVPLKAQDSIMKFYLDCEHQLLIVGPSGNDEYYSRCNSMTNNKIIMTGSRSDISRLLKASDYFISPSLHEGLPIAVLEAGAQGLPCLLFNIPGHTTFNTEKECVLIYNNSKELNHSTLEILNRKNELVDNFASLIHKKYSSEAMAKKYLALYEEYRC